MAINKEEYFILYYSNSLGTTVRRRTEEIQRLNEQYLEIVPVKLTLQKCIKYMCVNEPYRMLKGWSYEMEAQPLDNDQPAAATPELTDVS